MSKQMLWVLRTYLSNKLFLAVLAFACWTLALIAARGMFGSKLRVLVPFPFPWFAGVGPAALASAVGGVLAMQFRSPASRLSPRFVQAHAWVAAVWLVTIVAGVSFCTWIQNQPLLATTVFSIGITGFFFGIGVGSVKPNSDLATELRLLDKLLRLGTMIVMPLWVFSFGRYMAGELFSGQRVYSLTDELLIYGMLLLGTGLSWHACQTLRTLAGATATFGNAPDRAATSSHRGAMFAEESFESFLKNWRSPAHKSTLWNRVLRWRAGNPRTLPVLTVVLGSLVLALGTWILPVISPAHRQTLPPLRLGVYPTFTLFITSILIAYAWRKRLTCLDIESLRPTRRTSLQREWAASLASDLIPPALTAGAIATLSIQLRDQWFSPIAWQALIADWAQALFMLVLLSATLWLASLAFASIIVVIERQWLGLTIAFGTFFLGGIPFGALLGRLTRQMRVVPDPNVAIPLLLIPATVSAVAIVSAWRLWTRIDFDRRS